MKTHQAGAIIPTRVCTSLTPAAEDSLSALEITSRELSAMPKPASQGGIQPTSASGMLTKLYSAAQARFYFTMRMVLRARRTASATSITRPLWIT